MVLRSETFRQLTSQLNQTGYEWQPQTPDRLLKFRKDPVFFRPLIRCLGLGLEISQTELLEDGFNRALFEKLLSEAFFIQSSEKSENIKSTLAISGAGDLFIVHDHWPPHSENAQAYIHFASESAWMGREIQRDLEGFIGKKVLDFGCSSGALSFEVAGVADEVVGLDISERAIEWANLISEAYHFPNAKFYSHAIGSPQADIILKKQKWDWVISNPPMVVPSFDAKYPHRDGGPMGIELPLLFIENAEKALSSGGHLMMLTTNPIVHGKPLFFSQLEKKFWFKSFDIIEKRCLHPHFNQSVDRKQGNSEKGISNIELYFLLMQKK